MRLPMVNGEVDYEETYSRVVELAPSLVDFIDYVRNIKPPQMVEWQVMLQRILDGDQQAKHRVVEMYLRNVVRISLSFAEKYNVPIEDVIQDGVIGMLSAIEKFDTSETETFQQYYPFWVRQVIQRELPHYLYARYIPIHFHEKLLQINEYALERGFKLPEDFELIDSNFIAAMSSELDISLSLAEKYLRHIVPEISLEEMFEINPELDETESVLAENTIEDLVETLDRKQLRYALEATLATLTPREAHTLRLRNGFDDGRCRTLEEVGQEYNVTRERIRQIETKAMRKLRHPSRSKKLKDFLD